MRKLSVLLSITILASLVLAACTGGANNGGAITPGAEDGTGLGLEGEATLEPGAGDAGLPGTPTIDSAGDLGLTATPLSGLDTTGTPQSDMEGQVPQTGVDATGTPVVGTDTTSTPLTGGDATATPLAGGDATATITPLAGGDTTATPLTGADATATPLVGVTSTPLSESDLTLTPQAGAGQLPPAGADADMVLLSALMQSSINGQGGQPVGNISGVLIQRAADPSGTDTGTGGTSGGSTALATPTSAVNAGMPTDEITAEQGVETEGGASALLPGQRPQISHVLVSPQGGGANNNGGVLVPWQLFEVDSQASGAAGSQGGLSLTLNADASALTGAPAFTEGDTSDSAALTAEADAYWASQGQGIPQSGSVYGEMQPPLLIRGQIGSLPVTGANGQGNFGQVRDFVVNPLTGELMYAVLGGGPSAQGQLFVVPAHLLTVEDSRSQGEGQGQLNSAGRLRLDVSEQAFQGAPSIGSVDELDLSSPAWGAQYETYWNLQAGQNR